MIPLDPAAAAASPDAPPAPAKLHAPPPPAALHAPPGLEAVARTLTQRGKAVLVFGGLALVLGAAAGWFLTPARYLAQGSVHLLNKGRSEESDSEFLNFQRTQMTALRSYTLLRAVLDIPDIADLTEVQAHGDANDAVLWLQKELVIEPVLNNPEVLRLSLSGRNPEDLARVLNKIIDQYVKYSKDEEAARIRTRIKQQQDARDAIAVELKNVRGQIDLKQSNLPATDQKDVDELEDLRKAKYTELERLGRLKDRIRDLEFELSESQTKIDHPEAMTITGPTLDRELDRNLRYQKVQTDLFEAEKQFQQAFGPASPAARFELQRKYDEKKGLLVQQQDGIRKEVQRRLQAELAEELRGSALKTAKRLKLEQAEEEKTNRAITDMESRLTVLRGKVKKTDRQATPEVAALLDKRDEAETAQKKIGVELEGLKVELTNNAGRARPFEAAQPPTEKKIDKKIKVAGLTGLSLFGLVFLGIAFAEFRLRRVYTRDDVTRGLGMPLVGTLPTMPAEARSPVPGPSGNYAPEQGPLLEAVDGIRTLLVKAAQTDGVRVIMVTSAGGGEGKTFLASHLAASLARGWRNTLLIDADLRNPAAHAQFGISATPGLCEVLRGEQTPGEVIKPTALPRLSLLPPGRCDAYTLQALAQEEVGRIVAHLKEDYDFVVIDISPVLAVTDALLLGQHADAVILSVRKNVSRLPALYDAQQRLAALDIPILGAVVIGESVDVYGINPYPLRLRG